MKLFEELMDKTVKFADEAVKVGKEALEQTKVVAGEAVEKGKKKMNELQLESDLKDAYRRLGALVYSRHKSGESDEETVLQYISEIEKLEKALEELKSEGVNENDNYTVYDFKDDVAETAAEIAEDVKEEAKEIKDALADEEVKVCPSCGAEAGENDVFCHDCGNKLN